MRSAATPTGHLEIHVLRGDHRYQAFGEQAPIALPARVSRSMRFLITHAHGFAALYGVYAARRIVLVSLAPLPRYHPQTHTVRRT